MADVIFSWNDMDQLTRYYGRLYDKLYNDFGGVDNADSALRQVSTAKLYVRGGNDLITGRGKADGTIPILVTATGTPDSKVVIAKDGGGNGNATINGVEYEITAVAAFDLTDTANTKQKFDGDGLELNAGEGYGVTIYMIPTNSTTNAGTVKSVKGPKAKLGCITFPSAPAANACILAWVTVNYASTIAIQSTDISLAQDLADFTGLQDSDSAMALFSYAKSAADAFSTTTSEMCNKLSSFINQLESYILGITGYDLRTYYYNNNLTFDAGFSRLYQATKTKCPYVRMGYVTIGNGANAVTYTDGVNDINRPGTIPIPTDVQMISSILINTSTVFTVWYTNDAYLTHLALPIDNSATTPIKVVGVTGFETDFSYARIGAEVISYSGIVSGLYLYNVARAQCGTSGQVHTAGSDVMPCTSVNATFNSGVVSGTIKALGISTTDVVNVTGVHSAALAATGAITLRNI